MMMASARSRLEIGARRLWLLTTRELWQLARDPMLAGFIVYSFTLNLWLAGHAISLQLRDARVVVHDGSRSGLSREIVGRFQRPYFDVVGEVLRPRDGLRMLDAGRAMVLLDLPPDLERVVRSGRSAAVQMQVDATNPGLAVLASSWSSQIGATLSAHLAGPDALVAGAMLPTIVDDHRVWFNPNQVDAWATSSSSCS